MENYENLYPIDCIHGARQHLKDNSVDLIITDPPYGIEGDKIHVHYNRKEKNVIEGYVEIPIDKYAEFSKTWILEAERVLRPGGSIYIISGYSNLTDILIALRGTELKEVNHLIWKYNFGVYTSKKYISSHYHILYYVKPGGQVTFNNHARFGPDERGQDGGSLNYRDREDVWIINREYKHGEIKNKNELPMELIIKMIQYSSNEGDKVADFFLGGFSTAKAAIGMNRRITGFEINRKSYYHHIRELKHLETGYLLETARKGKGKLPENLRKRWTLEEKNRLSKRFTQVYKHLKNKRQSIKILEKEFGRGYFAILRQLDKIGKSGK
jgi:site-specific DNA-methyltransferase (adenine-specific)